MQQAFLFASLAATASAATYDFVVIGGGTAGLTIANRLSENAYMKVAVLEAGPNAEHLPEVFIPGLIGTGQSIGGALDWQYTSVPQANLGGRQIVVHAGKALGGSTVLNGMIFPRAEKEQYDAWGTLNNSTDWSFDALLPFFEKSETVTPPDAYQASNGAKLDLKYRGTSGPIKVGYANYFFEQSNLWRQAAAKLGIPVGSDLTNGDAHAVALASNSLDARNNTRCSAACAYYTPCSKRPNFTVLTNSTVTRILWASTGKRDASGDVTASGVEYVDANGKTQAITVAREVIVSAGTLGSPKVLELSGVGNKTILQAAGVELVVDLPSVGENLSDHVHSWANAFAVNVSITKDVLAANPAFAEQQLALWHKNRTGLYSAAPRSLSLAAPSDLFDTNKLKSLLDNARRNLNDYASQFSNGNTALAKGIAAQHNIALDLYASNKQLPMELNFEPGYSGPTAAGQRPARNYSTVNAVFYAPLSRGRVHISTSNPKAPPAIDPAYWSHPLDIASHVAGLQVARNMLNTAPLSSIYGGEFEPGKDKVNDEQVEDWLRSVAQSDNHEVGTMVMLPKELGGVVDTKLKVYGMSNVRVVDASVFPLPLPAHISSSVYAVAEKAAGLVKKDNNLLTRD
ncbi:alcohol oxidase [Auricularia subglabra TFB-10046 SS5]|uniref:Alcohol oxidase n=1 Tax=Auricularia subglabra (strain TFB-10046 / SS5) TaxID=717982 RepID=J0WTG1_AURST|nr:alcohol oxidase [Auricularia subglabra TFB-10046 SS5]